MKRHKVEKEMWEEEFQEKFAEDEYEEPIIRDLYPEEDKLLWENLKQTPEGIILDNVYTFDIYKVPKHNFYRVKFMDRGYKPIGMVYANRMCFHTIKQATGEQNLQFWQDDAICEFFNFYRVRSEPNELLPKGFKYSQNIVDFFVCRKKEEAEKLEEWKREFRK